MNLILGLIVSAFLTLGSGTIAPQKIEKPRGLPETVQLSNMCLSEKQANEGVDPGNVRVPKVLKKMKKATPSNTSDGFEIEKCQGKGSCSDVPEIADYKLVATNVRFDHVVYPNAFDKNANRSDRQLVKQLDYNDNPILKDRYKNRIYKTFCGDWCYTCPPDKVKCSDNEGLNCTCTTSDAISLPFRGSFHCNFIFYLQDEDEDGNLQVDESGNIPSDRINPADSNLPKDKSLFSVYFRIGATVPDNIKCEEKKESSINTTGIKNLFSEGPAARHPPVVSGETPHQEGTWLASPMRFTDIEGFDLNSGKATGHNFIKNIINYFTNMSKIDGKVYAQNSSGTTLVYPPNPKTYWVFEPNRRDPKGFYKGRNTQITTEVMKAYTDPATGTNTVNDPYGFPGSFEVYKNILDPENDNYIYLVKQGAVKDMLFGLANPKSLNIKTFEYLRYSALNTTEGSQKTIKLGKFKPIVLRNWISKWAEESKPAIYIYPEAPTDISVKLHTKGYITVSDPFYEEKNGWQVKAFPGGNLLIQGKNYPYLYYEAKLENVAVERSGDVVSQKDLNNYFQKKLKVLGLNPSETYDFVQYWKPRLLNTRASYFFIHFLDKSQIDRLERMETSVLPDVSIRIRAYFKPLSNHEIVQPQIFPAVPIRKGLTIVEWGGILDEN